MSNQEEEFALTPAEIERAEQAWAERNRPEGLVWNEETQQFESEWPALNVNPELQEFIDAGANIHSFHPEADNNHEEIFNIINESNCNPGIAIHPNISVNSIQNLLPKVKMVIVMTVANLKTSWISV